MSDKFAVQDCLKAIQERLKFFRNSYQGGEAYRKGQYLKQHKREKEADYTNRLKFAAFRNFCAAIIDLYTAYLYREEPTREMENLEKETEAFMLDADFEKHSWPKFIRETSRRAGNYGMFGLIVDKPKSDAKTKGDENANDIRPYVVPYSPLQFIQILWQRINGKPVLVKVVLEEDTGVKELKRYRVWTREEWEVWEIDTRTSSKDKNALKTESGKHTLKEIPFVLVKNRDKFHKIIGLSDIEDIADINKRIYNLDSYADIIIADTGFPFLELPGDSGEGETVIGTGNVLTKNSEGHGSEWVEPAHTSLPNILEWRREAVEDIRDMAKTGKTSTESGEAESGVALEIRYDQMNALLSDKATNMQGAENEVFRIFGLWQAVKWDGKVTYPEKFGVRDLMHDIDLAITASMAIPSKTFDAQQGLKLAKRILKDADKATFETIEKELTTVTDFDEDDDAGGGAGN